MLKRILKDSIFTGLFLVPFIPFLVSSSLFFPFITTKAFVWRIIVEIVFTAWILLILLDSKYRPKKSIILYALFGFIAVIGVADLLGTAPLKSFWSNFERMEGFVSLLHLGAFFLVIGSMFKPLDWKRWWGTSLVASFIMILYSFMQLAGRFQIHQGGARVDGTLGNASYLAVYMLIHIFVALTFLWGSRKDKVLRIVYGLLVVMQTFVLYHTATRGAILGLLGGLTVTALLNIKNKENSRLPRLSLIAILSLLIVSGSFVALRNSSLVQNSPVLSRFASISSEELKSGGRSFVWPMAIQGIKEKPILGWGQENFSDVFNKHYNPRMYNLEPWFDRAHNIFLDWGVAGGLLGLLSYLSLYVILIYLIWWRTDEEVSYVERSLWTGLIVSYFIHNLFVFDQLISYVLFVSVLAYFHSCTAKTWKWKWNIDETMIKRVVLPSSVLVLALVIYFINIGPIIANTSTIDALNGIGSVGADKTSVIKSFERAYDHATLGKTEILEQISLHANDILSSDFSVEARNGFFDFAKNALTTHADKNPQDARFQIVVGSFLTTTGFFDEGYRYLEQAKKDIPNKQQVYFEMGSALLGKGDSKGAEKIFKQAYELAPDYLEARIIYLVGAIYAGDRSTESEMLSKITVDEAVFDDRVLAAYYTVKRYSEVRKILEGRIQLDPDNEAKYREYLKQIAN